RLSTMGQDVRVTAQLQRVVLLFLRDPSERCYGLEIAREAGLQRGTLYPILNRLEHAGWVTSEWEAIDPSVEGRRPRRYYRLTDDGLRQAERIRQGVINTLELGTATT
ncbi:MAG: PadR family transcriptional regulator, partial [Egibacteraceae bacterium]